MRNYCFFGCLVVLLFTLWMNANTADCAEEKNTPAKEPSLVEKVILNWFLEVSGVNDALRDAIGKGIEKAVEEGMKEALSCVAQTEEERQVIANLETLVGAEYARRVERVLEKKDFDSLQLFVDWRRRGTSPIQKTKLFSPEDLGEKCTLTVYTRWIKQAKYLPETLTVQLVVPHATIENAMLGGEHRFSVTLERRSKGWELSAFSETNTPATKVLLSR